MAAIASHHVRRALFPLRLDTDRSGYVNIPHSLSRQKWLLMDDVNTIRATNNAIFNDTSGLTSPTCAPTTGSAASVDFCKRTALAPLLSGFEAIDQGRRVVEDQAASPEARRRADDLIWEGNVQLLEHEQRALVQPNFDRLSRAFARLVSIGSATRFEVHGMRQEVGYFTSFYLYSLTRGVPQTIRARTWPRITLLDDRWRWLVTGVVPRFRRFDADSVLIDAGLQRIFDEAQVYASAPCVLPRPQQVSSAR